MAEIKKTHAVLFSLPESIQLPAIMHYPKERLIHIKMKNYEKSRYLKKTRVY